MGIRAWLVGLNSQTMTTKLAVHHYALDHTDVWESEVEWEHVRPSKEAQLGFAPLFGDDRVCQSDRLYLALIFYCTVLTSGAVAGSPYQRYMQFTLGHIAIVLGDDGFEAYRNAESSIVEKSTGQPQQSYRSTLFRARTGSLMNYDELSVQPHPDGAISAAMYAVRSAVLTSKEHEVPFVIDWLEGIHNHYLMYPFSPGSSVVATASGFTEAIQAETRRRAAKLGIKVPDFS